MHARAHHSSHGSQKLKAILASVGLPDDKGVDRELRADAKGTFKVKSSKSWFSRAVHRDQRRSNAHKFILDALRHDLSQSATAGAKGCSTAIVTRAIQNASFPSTAGSGVHVKHLLALNAQVTTVRKILSETSGLSWEQAQDIAKFACEAVSQGAPDLRLSTATAVRVAKTMLGEPQPCTIEEAYALVQRSPTAGDSPATRTFSERGVAVAWGPTGSD